MQFRLHGIEHATLDKGGGIHLGLLDILFINGGGACGCVTNSGLKYIGHLVGCEENPQSAKLGGEVRTISLKFLFVKECA
jgi:hypothetical protein